MKRDANCEQWLYWRELRIKRLWEDYVKACTILKDFEHSSTGIALAKKIRELEAELPPSNQ